MKHKMNKTLESNIDNDLCPPFPDERRPTLYTAMNENTMLDYGEAPDLPSARMESEYVEMDSVEMPPVKETSHYEIEDKILEVKTRENKIGTVPIGRETNEVPLIIKESQYYLESNPLYSPSHLLVDNDKIGNAQNNDTAYVNTVSDQ